MIKRLFHFINRGIWQIQLEKKAKWLRYAIEQLQVLIIAVKGFQEDQLILRASALTYYSLLSIVPAVAMVFGIAKGFHLEKNLKEQIINSASTNQDIWFRVFEFAESLLNNTKGGIVAGLGVALLFWSVMKLLNNVEGSFNDVWQINSGRSWVRKFTDYFSILLISPILLILSGSMTIYIRAQVEYLTTQFELLGAIGPLLNFGFKLIPYILIWLAFTLLFMVMPNTRVKFKGALIAGIVAGTGFQLFEWLYITFQFGVTRYNAIYGSFAALPLFLFWLQTSWLIVLFGSELAFAYQNVEQYIKSQQDLSINSKSQKTLALILLIAIAKQFYKKSPPLSASELSNSIDVSPKYVQHVLNLLEQMQLICTSAHENGKSVYIPASDLSGLTIHDVEQQLDDLGQNGTFLDNQLHKRLIESLKSYRDSVNELPENCSISQLIKRSNDS